MSIAAHSILTSNKQSTSDATKLKGRKLVTGEGCGQADICEATDRELFHLLNCYSSDHSKRRDFSNAAVLKAIRSDPSSAKIKYPFIKPQKRKYRGSPSIRIASPLFQIVGLPGVSLQVVKELHRLNPESIKEHGPNRTTVLHRACKSTGVADYKIIKYLVKHYPEACGITSHCYTPLHSLVQADLCSVKLAKLFVKTNMQILRMKTQLKETPRDTAIRKMQIQDSQSHSRSHAEKYSETDTNKKETDSTKSRLQQIKEGNYGRRARPKLNEGATYVIVTQELIDILTPACDKREQEERETRKGLVKKFSSLFSYFTSHTRRFKSVMKCKCKRKGSMRFSYATSRSSYSNKLEL